MMTYGLCAYEIDHNRIEIRRGEMVLIPKGVTLQTGELDRHTVDQKYVVVFTDQEKGLPVSNLKSHVHHRTKNYEFVRDRFSYLHSEWSRSDSYFEILCEGVLKEILVLLNRELDESTVIDSKTRLVASMKEYIQSHHRERITKNELSRFVRLSPNYVSTLFHLVSGQTISHYVHSIRVNTAIQLLLESQLTVGAISEFVGYSDPSYFYKIFVKLTGRRPVEYRQERDDF